MTDGRSDSSEQQQVSLRLPMHLVEAVREHRDRMLAASPGVSVSIADAYRALLLAGLSSVGSR